MDNDHDTPVTEADDHEHAAPTEHEPDPATSYSVRFFFSVEMHHDDSVVIRTEPYPGGPMPTKQPTTADIVSAAQRVVTELNNGVIVNAMTELLARVAMQRDEAGPSQADSLRAALAERGIELSFKDPS